MGTTRRHDHHCPYCEEYVECETAARDDVGCIFPSTDDLTCTRCANLAVEAIDSGHTGTEVVGYVRASI